MNFRHIISLIILASSASSHAAISTFPFKTDSRLASGKWVKVEIDRTGLYGISYDQLREMGFTEPANVGVYGRGGELLSTNFSSATDAEAYSDDLNPVAVIHDNNSLYFYAKNTERITFSSGTAPFFNRGLGNLYSTSAYYFLSDSESPMIAEESSSSPSSPSSPSSLSELTTGWDYIYHEQDLYQNTTNTGQVFWGEDFINGQNPTNWNLLLRYNAGETARVAFRFYTSPSTQGSATVKFGDVDKAVTHTFSTNKTYNFYVTPVLEVPETFSISTREKQALQLSASATNPDFLNLDYWLVSYRKRLPEGATLIGSSAERYTFVTERGADYTLHLNPGLRLIDITDPGLMKLGKRDAGNPNSVYFTANGTHADMIIYDPAKPQLSIKSWKEVANRNLHAIQREGVDMMIVVTPKLRPYAERLARLHYIYQAINVAIATPEEIYDEFSAGVPDPMAYRALSKMIYQAHPGKYRNMLLFGPSDRNLRYQVEGETKFDRIIAYQQISVTPERDAAPAYDFYGILENDINENYPYNEEMQVGVGLLSCETEADCERILSKIERYLTDDTQAWRVNETLTIGGTGDNHTHDQQAEDYGNLIRNGAGVSGMCHTTIATDAYGNDEARAQLIRSLDRGKTFSAYFGHGGPSQFNKDKKFFTTAEAVNLRNPHPGFIFMGGCDFSTPDIRSRGLGETLLLDTEHGMIGAIVSTRTAWSNQNFDLGKKFVSAWLAPKSDETSPTIGEIYARVKSGRNGLGSNVMNSMTFVLAGDPALKVPSPIRNVVFEMPRNISPGEKMNIEGKVTYRTTGKVDMNFNGKVVLKLMQPSRKIRSKDYITNTCNTKVGDVYYVLDVTYDSNILTAVEAEVSEGSFSVPLIVPSDVSDFNGETLRLNAGVFDKSRWLGGSGSAATTVSENCNPEAETDMDAPMLTLRYDSSCQTVIVSASDDNAMLMSADTYSANIDGRPCSLINESYCQDGESGTDFSAYADVCHLIDGKHEISVTVNDIAGNSVSSTLEFEKIPTSAPLTLILSKKAVVDDIGFRVEGDFQGALDFEITDTAGNTVMKRTENMDTFSWDCRDMNGKRVRDGIYRVRVRSAEGAQRTLYSEWENFGVFD